MYIYMYIYIYIYVYIYIGLRRNYLYKYNTLRRNNKFSLQLNVSCIKFGIGILTLEKFSRVLLANFNSFKSVVPCSSILYLRPS